MTQKNKKNLELIENEEITSIKSPRNTSEKGSKTIRRINPLGYRVVVKIAKDNDMTDAGLYLPEGAKQNMHDSLLAQVIEVASAVDEDTHEEANVSGIPLGAKVLIPKDMGIRVPWNEELRIIETKHILAIVEEVHLT